MSLDPIFSSPELKAQVSFSDHLLSLVCLSVCLSVRLNISHHHLFLQNHWTNFNQTWHKASLAWMKGIQVSSNEEPINSHKDNNEFFPSLNQRYDIIKCVY